MRAKPQLKRCDKCGAEKVTRDRRCKRRLFGRGSYCCWGALTRVVVQRLKLKADAAPPSMQAEAAKKLARVRTAIVAKTRTIARLTKALAGLQQRAVRLERVANMTDAEAATERESRSARAAKAMATRSGARRRGIALTPADAGG